VVGDLAAEAAMEIALAKIANCRCDYPEAVTRLRAAIDLAQRGGWRQAQAVAVGSLAALQDELGETRAAARQLRTALVFSRQTGDRLQEGRTLVHLGIYHSEQGRLATADRLFAMALDRIDAEGSRIGRAIVLNNLAELCILRRRFDDACGYADEVLDLCAELGHVASTIVACNVMSAAHRGQGDASAAQKFATRSLDIATTLGDAYSLGIAHHEVAGVHDAAGDHLRGITHHREAHRFTAGIQSRFLDVEHTIALALAKHRLAVRSGDRLAPNPHEMHRALRRARGNGYRGLAGTALAALAETHHDCGDRDGAKRYARQSLSLQSGAGWRTDAALLTVLARYGRRTSRVYRNYAAHY
jgi:tetratricopeptide (TPR) repeat protein